MMNRILKYLTNFLVIALVLSSCKEIGPEINLINPDGKVLIEVFSGVRCVNCPEGMDKLESLLDIHGSNLVAVSIHAGFFAEPLNESQVDFRTDDAESLNDFLGPVTFYPSGVVNRNIFDGENNEIINSNKWAGYIIEELSRPSPIQLTLESTFDPDTRLLSVSTSSVFFEDLEDPVNLSIFIKENNIIDPQMSPNGIISDYVHDHVFRTSLTNFNGNPIADATISASPVKDSFVFTLPTEWKASDCSVIAFISRGGTESDVLQVEEVKIIQ